MALEQEEKQIGETHYRVTQLPGSKGQRLLVHLYKIAGPAMAELLRGFDGAVAMDSVLDMDLGFLANAVIDLADRINDDELEDLVTRLAASTEISVDQERWLQLKDCKEQHFAGNYKELFLWLGFALEVNYADFFGGSDGFRDAMSKLATPTEQAPSGSPKVSTGTSTRSQRRSATRAAS